MKARATFVFAALLHLSLVPCVAEAQPRCAIALLSTLPLGNDDLFLHVPVIINGQQRDMILDTGSEGSLITPVAAHNLSLPGDPMRRTLIHGPNGRSDLVPNRLVSSLRLGRVGLGGWSVPLGVLPNLPGSLESLAGLIGANIFQPFMVEFDAPNRTLRLWHMQRAPQKCVGTAPPPLLKDGHAARWVRLSSHRRGLRLNVGFTLDGVDGNALIDSGARSITLSRRFANMMGVSDASLARDRGGVTSGIDLNARSYHWHPFKELRFHGDATPDQADVVTLHNPMITVTDIDDDTDMLLGADWLARHNVMVSFQTGEVWVR